MVEFEKCRFPAHLKVGASEASTSKIWQIFSFTGFSTSTRTNIISFLKSFATFWTALKFSSEDSLFAKKTKCLFRLSRKIVFQSSAWNSTTLGLEWRVTNSAKFLTLSSPSKISCNIFNSRQARGKSWPYLTLKMLCPDPDRVPHRPALQVAQQPKTHAMVKQVTCLRIFWSQTLLRNDS